MTDASLQKIAAAYSTPTFVFDTDALQARVRAIQTIWGREIDLCYSIKANPFLLPAMMQVTARLEVCSPGELSLCESLHAADARVIYSGVNKTPVDIARAVADGVGTCTAESLLQVRYLQDAARKAAKRPSVSTAACAAAAERGQSVRHVKGGSFHRISASQGNT